MRLASIELFLLLTQQFGFGFGWLSSSPRGFHVTTPSSLLERGKGEPLVLAAKDKDEIIPGESVQEYDDDDDDGWGEKEALLTELREKKNKLPIPPPENDLFVPIFSIVAVAGFFGVYAYETLRLASRGELYLPWNSN